MRVRIGVGGVKGFDGRLGPAIEVSDAEEVVKNCLK
jgi:hypothetical protein